MSSILLIGDFLPVAAEGYLINPCRYERIVPPWSDIVAAIKAAYLHHLAEKVHRHLSPRVGRQRHGSCRGV